jgi:dipeptidase E
MNDQRRIVAMGGGGFSSKPGDPELDRYVLEQASSPNPRICLLPTASGDPDDQIQRFYQAFHDLPCTPSHLSLFRLGSNPVNVRAKLLEHDVIYVGGGSMTNLLAIWRVHGVDRVLEEAWNRGIVLAGISAGSMCWFQYGVTKSHGTPRAAEGLGFLPFSNSVHWRSETERRIYFRRAVRDGDLPPGFGVDDGTALLFAGTEFAEAAKTQASAGARFVTPDEESDIYCDELPAAAVGADAELVSIEEFREAKRLQHG